MRIKWLGHACFLITTQGDLKIITDPYSAGAGIRYGEVKEAADIVTVSHGHGDHNNTSAVTGNSEIISTTGAHEVKGIAIKGIATHHDQSAGNERGSNIIYCFSMDGVVLCHLGDLGHALKEPQIAEIGNVDILLVPVGGFFTIDAQVASEICEELKPRVIIPMHYKTAKLDYPIAGVDDFISGKQNVKRINASEVLYTKDQLPSETAIVVLEHAL